MQTWKIHNYADIRAEWKVASEKHRRLIRKCEQARRLSDGLYTQMETLRKELETDES